MEVSKLERYVYGLKKEIKRWEHSFQSQNGKTPTTEVIKSNPAISARYKKYNKYKKILTKLQSGVLTVEQWKQQEQPETKKEPNSAAVPHSPPLSSPDSEREIGPTPQLDGRVLGIFDIEIKESPTKQTPTKQQVPFVRVESPDTFKTPTKPVERKLLFGETPRTQRRATVEETPQYLRTESYNSGEMLFGFSTPEKRPADQNDISPSKVVEPSPVIRRLGSRSLYELNQEALELQRQHTVEIEEEDPEDATEEVQEPEEAVLVRKKTAKRTTRRVKLKTLGPENTEDELGSVDLQFEIKRLREHKDDRVSESESSEEEEEEEEEDYIRKKVQPTDKKSTGKHPLSNNFVRMKIHRKNRGRFRRR
ncbi:hypothetical protein OGAPHI_000240 [Ogataea philodendri]|uniref:DNA replication regulator SLD2 n=1 Tax=Ogataea philodendri TaxID=1378263 RepID=A0A9P8PGB6_9ASCO|nr:uncharacterized protein OGAPHI_000240 [Ogataea philodendri]KAH3671537.1 hypothetical protein OGAPHI_000240 [Ogataea philodendri]